MGLLSEGFYGVIFFGEEEWGGYIRNFIISQTRKAQQIFIFSMFPFKKHVFAGLKTKGYWINWKLHLSRQLLRLGHDEQTVVLKDFLLA